MSTTTVNNFKMTQRSLVFHSAKDFLEAVGTIFQFRYTKDTNSDNKFHFEFKKIDAVNWVKTKYVHVTLKHHTIAFIEQEGKPNWRPRYILQAIITNEESDDEAKYLMDLQDYLNHRVLDATICTSQPIEKRQIDQIKDLVIYPPYQFKPDRLQKFQESPGLVTLRISRGYMMYADNNMYHYGAFLEFNTWKITDSKPLLKRQRQELPLPPPEEPSEEIPTTEEPPRKSPNTVVSVEDAVAQI